MAKRNPRSGRKWKGRNQSAEGKLIECKGNLARKRGRPRRQTKDTNIQRGNLSEMRSKSQREVGQRGSIINRQLGTLFLLGGVCLCNYVIIGNRSLIGIYGNEVKQKRERRRPRKT